ncbi:MAG: hypothetical protein JWQ65_138 [Devosia sp.]|nr:hypothetical protein [Devosia sp.]
MSMTEGDLVELRAVRYFDAARVLHQHSGGSRSYWEPLNHLLAMAAELTLKAYLIRAGEKGSTLKGMKVRHSLNALLRLAIARGLQASDDAVNPLLMMSRAHSDHSFRYTGMLAEGQDTLVFHAPAEAAITGIGCLLDFASRSPGTIRSYAASGIAWPAAAMPEYPVTLEQLALLIQEVASDQEFAERTIARKSQ